MKLYCLLLLAASYAILLMTLGAIAQCPEIDEESPPEPIDAQPHIVRVQPGRDATMYCCLYGENITAFWILPNGTNMNEVNISRIVQTEEELENERTSITLQINGAEHEDSGIYTCSSDDLEYNDTIDFKVYDMPSYTLETTVILSINIGLLIIFAGCLGYSTVKQRKAAKKQAKYTPVKRKENPKEQMESPN